MRRFGRTVGRVVGTTFGTTARAVPGVMIGLITAGLAVGVGELVAVWSGPQTAPAIAVGSAAIDLTPTPLKEYAIRNFGTDDKPVLLTGIYLTLAAIAVAAGILAVRRPMVGVGLVAVFGAVGAWAALSRPTARGGDLWPSILGAVVAGAAMVLLVRSYQASQSPEESASRLPPWAQDRRGFLTLAAGAAGTAAVSGLVGRTVVDKRYNVALKRSRVRIPAPATRAAAIPPAVHPNVAGLSSFITPNSDFYRVDTALVLPQVDPDAWTLRIRGLVDRPLELSFAELLNRPLVEHDQTLSCVSNEVGGPYVGTARWIGASLADLLREAGVQRGADQLVGRSIDGMTIGTPVESVLDGRTGLLAVAMNGEPLPIAHGFPCRMLVPGFFGYVSATKWLVDLELTTFADYDSYWVRRGYSKIAPVKTASRIDVPKPFAKVPAGSVTVAGVAWATHRGIDAVEVRADGGPWQLARLAAADTPDTWRQWTHQLNLASGLHKLEVRATDATGAVQPEQRVDTVPNGATGWHSVVITAA
ncbi:molybdopterin-dependent oxidoreductase [Catenulispora sp. NF23]|uniref:molybdopterin-dependent oxidoreductase n=1 Tax=Catenulispora pinistramenti TaxID=2705254 RepID=UPI001BA44B72|nr:molybdopterin-dependent oxidoreductase [Catenulispora pinistramenti]